MENFAKTKENKNAGATSTLPISCQICLGKVQQPVICDNQHVFCSYCLDQWLMRIPQCPTCRVPITSENPPKPILGGSSQQDGPDDTMSNRDMRKTRVELLFKEYETEISRLETDVSTLREENKALHLRLRDRVENSSGAGSPGQNESDPIIKSLNDKLQNATQMYEDVKKEMGALQLEKKCVEDKNVELHRESQRLRLELSSRSPRKFGRSTVAALESRVETYEKQIKKLEKALEKSDEHIEHLEELLKEKSPQHKREKLNGNSKEKGESRVRFESQAFEELPSTLSAVSDIDGEGKERNADNTAAESTFDFEMPSPLNQKSKQMDLSRASSVDFESKNDTRDDTFCGMPSPVNVKKKLRFTEKEETEMDIQDSDRGNKSLNALNVSMTPEMEDCMKILDEAEKKIQQRHQGPKTPDSGEKTIAFSLGTITATQPTEGPRNVDINIEAPASAQTGENFSRALSDPAPRSYSDHGSDKDRRSPFVEASTRQSPFPEARNPYPEPNTRGSILEATLSRGYPDTNGPLSNPGQRNTLPESNSVSDLSNRNRFPDTTVRGPYHDSGPRGSYPESSTQSTFAESSRNSYSEAFPGGNSFPEPGSRNRIPDSQNMFPEVSRSAYTDPRIPYSESQTRTGFPDTGIQTSYPSQTSMTRSSFSLESSSYSTSSKPFSYSQTSTGVSMEVDTGNRSSGPRISPMSSMPSGNLPLPPSSHPDNQPLSSLSALVSSQPHQPASSAPRTLPATRSLSASGYPPPPTQAASSYRASSHDLPYRPRSAHDLPFDMGLGGSTTSSLSQPSYGNPPVGIGGGGGALPSSYPMGGPPSGPPMGMAPNGAPMAPGQYGMGPMGSSLSQQSSSSGGLPMHPMGQGGELGLPPHGLGPPGMGQPPPGPQGYGAPGMGAMPNGMGDRRLEFRFRVPNTQ